MHTAPMRDEHDAFCLVSGNCLADVDQTAQLAAGADAGCARAAQQQSRCTDLMTSGLRES